MVGEHASVGMMGLDVKIDIGAEFSRYPIGRYRADSPVSGEVFRDDVLVPAYKRARAASEVLEIDIDKVRSFGSSFLEEAFGGLIRNKVLSKNEFKENFSIVFKSNSNKIYADLIKKYVSDA